MEPSYVTLSARPPRVRRGPVQAWAIGEVLLRGERARVTVDGRSMMPTVFPGASLEVEPCESDAVRQGDVVVVLRGRRLLVHRALRRDAGGRWITRGDARAESDAEVGDEQLVGRVVGFPLGRRSFSLPEELDAAARSLLLRQGPALGALYRSVSALRERLRLRTPRRGPWAPR